MLPPKNSQDPEFVNDHSVARDAIAYAIQLERDLELVGEDRDGHEAMREFQRLRRNIALIDLYMPVVDGFCAMSQIREKFPEARLIALTRREPCGTAGIRQK